MTKRFLLLLYTLLSVQLCSATYGLLVSKTGEDKVFLLSKGAVVKLQFSGYQGQVQEFKGQIKDIDKQFVVLEDMALFKKQTFQIAVADILGFRPYSTGRQMGKSLVELGLFTGNLALYSAVIAPAALAPLAAAGMSVGVGLISYGLVRVLFPDKIKYTREGGWSFKVVEIADKKK